jgi:hypothetical protein
MLVSALVLQCAGVSVYARGGQFMSLEAEVWQPVIFNWQQPGEQQLCFLLLLSLSVSCVLRRYVWSACTQCALVVRACMCFVGGCACQLESVCWLLPCMCEAWKPVVPNWQQLGGEQQCWLLCAVLSMSCVLRWYLWVCAWRAGVHVFCACSALHCMVGAAAALLGMCGCSCAGAFVRSGRQVFCGCVCLAVRGQQVSCLALAALACDCAESGRFFCAG